MSWTTHRIPVKLQRIMWAILSLILLSNSSLAANPISYTKVKVSLLGQPCPLLGPSKDFDADKLRAVHALGPAEAYPEVSPFEAQGKNKVQKALDRLRITPVLPEELSKKFDSYRERLEKRLKVQSAFFDGVENLKKTHIASDFLKPLQPFLPTGDGRKKLEIQVQKLAEGSTTMGPQYRDSLEQVFDYLCEEIAPDPQQEYYDTIRKLGVKYECSFEEGEGASGG